MLHHSPACLRFAPSPNGPLHLGHAYSALLNAHLAKRLSGTLLIRLEDIDTQRCTTELANACLQDLRWLGLTWHEPVRIQSHHWEDYAAAAQRLKERDLLYPCFCSRADIAHAATATDPEGAPRYPGTCRRLSRDERNTRLTAGQPHSWRLDMQRALTMSTAPYTYQQCSDRDFTLETVEENPEQWGDVVVIRKDTPTSYHLSVVVDDALQGITHVVRGQDLEAATAVHLLLQRLLNLPTPHYHHHALLVDETGEKLAKRRISTSLRDLRAEGICPKEIRHMLGFK